MTYEYGYDSKEMRDARNALNAALDLLSVMRGNMVGTFQARDLTIAITHIEDALFRINHAAHS